MTKTRALLLVGIVMIASAYIGGFWPQRQRAREAEARAVELGTQVSALEARVRLAELLGLALRLSDSVVARNYGDASNQATAYFDRVAAEMASESQAASQAVLQGIHQTRDRVIASLARTEPAVLDTLREQEHALRRALGYPVPDRIPTTAAPASESPVEQLPPATVR